MSTDPDELFEIFDDLVEILDDLAHDLGKHIRLPLLLLPPDAAPAQVDAAARTALLRTRRGPAGVQSAADVWRAFLDEVDGADQTRPEWRALFAAVERALGWADRLDHPGRRPIDRAALTADLGAITPAIHALRDALTDG